jgi:hypothetical protein
MTKAEELIQHEEEYYKNQLKELHKIINKISNKYELTHPN